MKEGSQVTSCTGKPTRYTFLSLSRPGLVSLPSHQPKDLNIIVPLAPLHQQVKHQYQAEDRDSKVLPPSAWESAGAWEGHGGRALSKADLRWEKEVKEEAEALLAARKMRESQKPARQQQSPGRVAAGGGAAAVEQTL